MTAPFPITEVVSRRRFQVRRGASCVDNVLVAVEAPHQCDKFLFLPVALPFQ